MEVMNGLPGAGGRRFEDVKAYSALGVDVGVVDFGQEPDVRWLDGIVRWNVNVQLEDTTLVGTPPTPKQTGLQVGQPPFLAPACDTVRWILLESLQLPLHPAQNPGGHLFFCQLFSRGE